MAPEAKFNNLDESDVILDTHGRATLKAIQIRQHERLSYVRNPNEIPPIPEQYFEEGTPESFRALVREKLVKMLDEAKPEQVSILAAVNDKFHKESLEEEDVKALQEVFGPEVYRLGKNLEWYANLCKGDVPSRLTPDFIKLVHVLGLSAAHYLNTQIQDPALAGKIKTAFSAVSANNVVDPEVWKQISELEPVEFVKELYKHLGVHIGFQGLQHDELDRLKYDDLKRVSQFMLAGSGKPEEYTGWKRFKRKWAPSPTDRRSLDTMIPEVYIAFDKGLFPGLTGEEQYGNCKQLITELGENNLRPLGSIQIFDKACRTAIAKDGLFARMTGIHPIRITLRKPGADEIQFCDVKYNNPEDFSQRTIHWDMDTGKSKKADTGLAVGYVYPL